MVVELNLKDNDLSTFEVVRVEKLLLSKMWNIEADNSVPFK